eukprot:s792_g31.t1
MVCLLCGWLVLKRGMQWVSNLVARVRQCEQDIQAAQEQLADHYGFAADLAARLDDCIERSETRDDAVDGLAARVSVVEEDTTEGQSAVEESLDCLRSWTQQQVQSLKGCQWKCLQGSETYSKDSTGGTEIEAWTRELRDSEFMSKTWPEGE